MFFNEKKIRQKGYFVWTKQSGHVEHLNLNGPVTVDYPKLMIYKDHFEKTKYCWNVCTRETHKKVFSDSIPKDSSLNEIKTSILLGFRMTKKDAKIYAEKCLVRGNTHKPKLISKYRAIYENLTDSQIIKNIYMVKSGLTEKTGFVLFQQKHKDGLFLFNDNFFVRVDDKNFKPPKNLEENDKINILYYVKQLEKKPKKRWTELKIDCAINIDMKQVYYNNLVFLSPSKTQQRGILVQARFLDAFLKLNRDRAVKMYAIDNKDYSYTVVFFDGSKIVGGIAEMVLKDNIIKENLGKNEEIQKKFREHKYAEIPI